MHDIVRTGNGSGFEQVFKNIDEVLWKEAGCTTELDYTEQSSWMLFLKYLDDLEHERALKAQLQGKPYEFIIDEKHRWSVWAAPKKPDGSFDHDNALSGDDLIDFVDRDLFPYLHGFRQRATGPDTVEYKIGEIFGEIKSKFRSGYSLRDALELTLVLLRMVGDCRWRPRVWRPLRALLSVARRCPLLAWALPVSRKRYPV